MSSSLSTEYKLPHEQGFLTALTKKHLKDKEKTFENLEYFQHFISDFINVETPYRGILINFGLGAGKTRTAIACTDSFLRAGFNIVFISPASLRTNFDIELENYQPSLYKGKQSELKERITYMSYNAGASFAKSDPHSKKVGSMDIEGILDNKIIIIDEVHTLVSNMVSALRVGRYRGISIYDKLMSAKNSRIVALSGTPIINYPYEVAILMNILSGYQNKDHTPYSGDGPKYTLFPDGHQHFDFNKKNMGRKIYNDGEELFNSIYIEVTPEKEFKIKERAKTNFAYRLRGYVSYYAGTSKKSVFPDSSTYTIKVPMSNYQFNIYKKERAFEIEEMEKSMSSYTGIDDLEKKSSFRVTTRELCNFVFPKDIKRPWRRDIKLAFQKKYNLLDDTESEEEKKLQDNEKIQKMFEKYRKSVANEDDDDIKIKNQIIDTLYHMELEDSLKTLFNEDRKHNLVSGLNPKDIIQYKQDSSKKDTLQLDVSNRDKYEVTKILVETKEKKQEDKVYDGLITYSPKMLAILQNIDNFRLMDEKQFAGKTPEQIQKIPHKDGNGVIYSYFNSVEGINIFKNILRVNGYEPYTFDMALDPVDKKEYKGRYIVWEGSNEERNKILGIYNSEENKYGDVIKLILITDAGAEGITLKNVRHLHIMEPYWNEVQIRQVIGRAKRMNSHIALPHKEEHNVVAFRYEMSFTKEQQKHILKDLKWDIEESFTTDEVIRLLAEKKNKITSEIEEMMKQSAVDCILNKEDNKLARKEPIVCFDLEPKGESFYLDHTPTEILKSSEQVDYRTYKQYRTRIINRDNPTSKEYLFIFDKEKIANYPVSIIKVYLGSIGESYEIGKLYQIHYDEQTQVRTFASLQGEIYDTEKDTKKESKRIKYKLYEDPKNDSKYVLEAI